MAEDETRSKGFEGITERNKTEEIYRTMVQASIDGFWVADTQGRFLEVNDAYCRLIGYSRDELLNMRVQDVEAVETPEETSRHILKVIQQGYDHFETRHRRKDGKIIEVEVSVNYLNCKGGWFFVFLHDITRRKQNERERERLTQQIESERFLLDAVLRQMPAGVIVGEAPSGKLIIGNEQVERIWRHPFIQCKNIKEYQAYRGFHLDGRPYKPEEWPLARSITMGEVVIAKEIRFQRGDGSFGVMEVSSAPIRNREGRVTDAVVVFNDVTELKEAEEALRCERDNLVNIFKSMEDGVCVVNERYDLEYINPALERDFGPWNEEKCYEYLNGRKEVCPWCRNKEVFEGKTVRWELYSPKTNKTYDLLDTPIRNPDGSMSKLEIFRDITELKRAEEMLRDSERRFRSLVEDARSGICTIDLEGKLQFVNQSFADLLGYSAEELLNRPFRCFLHPDDENRVLELLVNVIQSERQPPDLEFRALHKDGRVLHLYTQPTRLFAKGEFVGHQAIITDLTERRKAEEHIRNLARFPSENPNPVIRITKDGTIAYTNTAGLPLLNEWKCDVGQFAPDYWRRLIAEVLHSGMKKEVEVKQGKKTFSLMLAPVMGSGYVNIYGIDVTERKRAEEVLEKERNMLKGIMENTDVMLAYFDTEFNFVAVNPAYANASGYSVEELIEKNHFALFPNEENQAIFKRVRDTGETVSYYDKPFEYAYQPERGITYWNWTLAPVKDETGRVQGLVLSLMETTQRKKAEDALRQSEARYRALVEPNIVGIVSADHEKIIDANDAFLKMVGYTRQDLVEGKIRWREMTPPEYKALDGRALEELFTKGSCTPFEKEYLCKNGSRIPVLIGAGLLQRSPLQWVCFVLDITERKRMEAELRDSLEKSQQRESEVSALLGAAKAVLQHRHFQTAARLIFGSCKDLLGATAGYVALLSKDGRDNEVLFLESGGLPCSVDPSLPMPIRGLRAEAYRTGKAVYHNDFAKSEYAKLMPQGHARLENVLFAPLIVDRKTVGIIGIANKSGGFTERDAQIASAFGELASVALINSRMLEMLEDNEKRLKAHSEHLEELVEERTKRLKDAQRLATIGETAGMVGHDIRNPLQSIIGTLYLAKQDVKTLPESEGKKSIEESLETIEEQVTYINKIVLDLQDFAKPLAPLLEETDMQKLIDDALSASVIAQNIEVSVSVKEDFPKLMVDPSYIKRVLVNLITNAVQAMPNGGKLTISTNKNEEAAFVNIEDTGAGIPEDVKPKIFQPLFTTKSRGQGFGLAVCKRLVEAHNGTITFESEVDRGTKFTIRIPLSKRKMMWEG